MKSPAEPCERSFDLSFAIVSRLCLGYRKAHLAAAHTFVTTAVPASTHSWKSASHASRSYSRLRFHRNCTKRERGELAFNTLARRECCRLVAHTLARDVLSRGSVYSRTMRQKSSGMNESTFLNWSTMNPSVGNWHGPAHTHCKYTPVDY